MNNSSQKSIFKTASFWGVITSLLITGLVAAFINSAAFYTLSIASLGLLGLGQFVIYWGLVVTTAVFVIVFAVTLSRRIVIRVQARASVSTGLLSTFLVMFLTIVFAATAILLVSAMRLLGPIIFGDPASFLDSIE